MKISQKIIMPIMLQLMACGLLAPPAWSQQVFINEAAFVEALPGGVISHDFESLPHATVVDSQLVGVDFLGTGEIYDEVNFPSGGATQSGTNVLLNETVFVPIAFVFESPVDGVGFFNTSIADRERVQLFDSENQLLFEGELPEGAVNFLGFTSRVPIASGCVTGIEPQTFGTIFIDDFYFGFSELLLGDVNCDGVVNLLDVDPFVELISSGGYEQKADINQDGVVNLLDVAPFVQLLTG